MKIKADFYVVMGIMAIALTAGLVSLTAEHWKCKLLPCILGGIIVFLCAVELRRQLLAGTKKEGTPVESGAGETKKSVSALRGFLVTGAWLVGFLLAVYVVGFFIAIPVFTLSYMKFHGTTWRVTILFTVIISGFMYGISKPLTGTPLYGGLFW